MAVDNRQTLPVVDFLESTTEALELVLEKERHDLRQLHRLFLRIGESRNPLSLDDRLALVLNVAKHGGGVANRGNGLAAVVEALDQFDRDRVFREIPHGAMAARVEDGVVIFRRYRVQPMGIG